jgi:hypothetical protein
MILDVIRNVFQIVKLLCMRTRGKYTTIACVLQLVDFSTKFYNWLIFLQICMCFIKTRQIVRRAGNSSHLNGSVQVVSC